MIWENEETRVRTRQYDTHLLFLTILGPGLVITLPQAPRDHSHAGSDLPHLGPMIVSALPPGSQALQVVPDLSKKVASTSPRKAVAAAAVAAVLWWPLCPPGRKKKRMLESAAPR